MIHFRKIKIRFCNLFQTLGFHVQRRFYQTSFIFLMTCQLILGFPLGMCLLFYSDSGVYGMYFSSHGNCNKFRMETIEERPCYSLVPDKTGCS